MKWLKNYIFNKVRYTPISNLNTLKKTAKTQGEISIFSFILKFFYFILWMLGIFVFIYLIDKIYTIHYTEAKIYYWSSIAILISAFLASTSVMLSIENSKKLIDNEKKIRHDKTMLHLQYLLISLHNELDQLNISYDGINKRFIESETMILEKQHSFFTRVKGEINTFLRIMKQFENPDLLLETNKNISYNIVSICISLSKMNKVKIAMKDMEYINKDIFDPLYEHIKSCSDELYSSIKEIEQNIRNNYSYICRI